MRKIAAAFMLLSLLASLTAISQGQSRARRVGTSTPAPAPVEPATDSESSARPPSLGGRTTGAPRASNSEPIAPASNTAPEEVGEDDIIQVSTTLVSIPVSVMDRNGRYIPDLRQEDFRIYENGVEQQVAYFASVERPFSVVLMLDTSGSTRFRIEDIQDAAIAFVDQLRADDRVMIIAFDDRIRVLAQFTNDRNELRSAIRRTRTGGGTRLYDALDEVINQHFSRVQGRKAIVLFTDGVDTTSRRASYESNVRDAEELDALIYPVQYDTYDDMASMGGGGGGGGWPGGGGGGVIIQWPFPFPVRIPGPGGRGGNWPGGGGRGGRGTSRSEYETANAYLRDLADKTGARLERADDTRNLARAFTVIAEELRRQYSIGYYPRTPAQAGERRQIRVRTTRPNLVVRSRDSYIFNQQGNNQTRTQFIDRQPFAPERQAGRTR